jgi:hypothetical protein
MMQQQTDVSTVLGLALVRAFLTLIESCCVLEDHVWLTCGKWQVPLYSSRGGGTPKSDWKQFVLN